MKGKKVVLTGGSSGIGKSIAIQFTRAGAEVAFADIDTPASIPDGAIFIKADITSPEDISNFFKKATEAIGTPDVLVCNAGRGIHEKLAEGDPEKWEYILKLNVMGALRTVRAFVPQMLQQGAGDVVFISSVSANNCYEGGAIYSATKAAIERIAETLRLEVQPQIRVTTIAPGVVDTNFFAQNISGSQTVESIGWGAVNPDEVARAVLYAVSQPPGTAINYITIRPSGQPL